jgi:alpha-tubulin suppressor-like RCC1 family protein
MVWTTVLEHRHSLAATDKSQVFSWGEGSWGKLGLDDVGNKTTPTLVPKGTPKIIVDIAGTETFWFWLSPHANHNLDPPAGNQHTLILGKDGVVYSCGGSTYGQLGHGDTDGQRVPRPISKLQGNFWISCMMGRVEAN